MSYNEDLEKAKYELLVKIQNGADFSSCMSQLGDDLFDQALESCCQYGYIRGAYPVRVASGVLTVDGAYNFGITEDGKEFIADYNLYNHR
ncbi:hypothetical protein D3P07_11615 [Paenibacillus sp. 1011MAR3C5]|uniref:hypothetical protein n=1 Tax=Paenibacillus sp. 1011MAR3C5 TaxID=1675787 RepID=UPI000E6B710B|nr:hypothetical protein [Paenibacillus sp. 1011MAR3C5]RJE88634.1 hypothetical protein D3P07_11615 [Paenibacillus sp. 1011MAR3C5]